MKFVVAAIICFYNFSSVAQVSWYKCLSGKIDRYPVTIHLHKRAHQYSGYYYYNSKQQPVYFFGEDSTVPGKIKLTAVLPGGQEEEKFSFTNSGKNSAGDWTNASGKTLSFSAFEITQQPSWDYTFMSGSILLRPKMQHSPVASYEAAAVWPQGDSAQSLLLKRIINEWYAKESSTTSIGTIFLKKEKQFFDNYLSENKNAEEAELANSTSFNAYEMHAINVVYQSSGLLTLANLSQSYSGGAHGNYGTTYLSVDLLHGEQLSLDNILSTEGQRQLAGLLEKHFRKEYNLKDTDALTEGGLFDNKIEPNANFFVTGKLIGFDYAPYEIGPYALGEIVIYIPLSELNEYLQPGFKSLLGD